jgi:hypothetical protein
MGPQGAQGAPGLSASDVRPTVWSGGCSIFGTSPEWNTYCLDSADFSTAGEHLTVGPTSIRFLKPGFYRINFWTIAFGPAYGFARFLRNGRTFHDGAMQVAGTNPQWRMVSADVLWPFDPGDELAVQTFNPGLYAFHSWSPSGGYSRLQVQYVGPTQ